MTEPLHSRRSLPVPPTWWIAACAVAAILAIPGCRETAEDRYARLCFYRDASESWFESVTRAASCGRERSAALRLAVLFERRAALAGLASSLPNPPRGWIDEQLIHAGRLQARAARLLDEDPAESEGQ